ncbi:MAG: transposase [Candidatus Magasanikbacteria bacterium]|nr:transposase [Candidatus Magasanikbacteria bacterium]
MPRRMRIFLSDAVYHVINRGNQRQPVFIDEADYYFYLLLLKAAKEKYGVKIFHYVLMPNHVHLLVQSSSADSISKMMQSVTVGHCRHFNAKYEKVGHAWQGRFRSIIIDSASYMLQCGRYIELNPVRARICASPKDYRWSSYHHYADSHRDSLVDDDFMLKIFGDSVDVQRAAYKKFVEDELLNARSHLSQRFSEKLIYGDNIFVARIKKLYNVRST